MGLAPGMELGISPAYSPSAPLSAQETNLGLNIDSLLHKTGMGGDRCRSVPVWFISLQRKTEIARTLASSAPSCRGEKGGSDGSRERETQVKAALTLRGAWVLGSGRIWGATRCW